MTVGVPQYDCDPPPGLPEVEPIVVAIYQNLNRHAAEVEDIERAHCKTKTAPSLKEINTFLAQKFTDSKTDEEIFGVQFVGESKEALRSFRDLTTAMHHLGLGEWPQSQVNIQEKFQVNPGCKKVSCAVEMIWGENLGKKLLFLHQKHGFNGSELSFSFSARFAPDEIDDVLMAMGDLPKNVQLLGDNQRLSRFVHPDTKGTVIADAVVRLFDPWVELHPYKRQYTIYHEMAHLLAAKLGKIDYSEEWLAMSGWVGQKIYDPNSLADTKWEATQGCFASIYAATNPAEDWAEALSAYRYNPESFKSRCPDKYNFIKEKVFKGVEYTSAAACARATH